jgi:hypothetical protein
VRDFGRESLAIDCKGGARWDTMEVAGTHDERTKRAHFLMKQANRIVIGIVRTEAVRTDHFGKSLCLVSRRGFTASAHFTQADLKTGLGQLPGRFGSREPAADYVDVEGHAGLLVRPVRAIQQRCASSP